MIELSVTIGYDTAVFESEVVATVEAEETSVSGAYFTFHLPKSANPAKLTLSFKGPAPIKVTILYDTDEAIHARVDMLVTSGATAYPCKFCCGIAEERGLTNAVYTADL